MWICINSILYHFFTLSIFFLNNEYTVLYVKFHHDLLIYEHNYMAFMIII